MLLSSKKVYGLLTYYSPVQMARLEGSLFYFLGDLLQILAVGTPKQSFPAERIAQSV